ncbi:hypothetical protein ACHAXT_001982 [Thalassiosira profunda]
MICPICLAAPHDGPDSALAAETHGDADAVAHGGANAGAPASFVTTPCNHHFCVPCIERVLLRPRPGGVPTSGPCPMCREQVSLFDLEGSACGVEEDMSSWPVRDAKYSQRALVPMQNASALLEGMIDRHGAIEGYGITFCFDESAASIDFAKPLRMAFRGDWTDDAIGHNLLDSIQFDRARFHSKSMTFCGNVSFANSPVRCEAGYFFQSLECLLHFSDNANYVRKGSLQWKYASTSAERYPLDGTWECQWGGRSVDTIVVQRHRFSCFDEEMHIVIDEKTRLPSYTWNYHNRLIKQTSTHQISGTGPGIGETLEWTTDLPGYEKIVWKQLETLESNKIEKCVEIKAGNFVYQRCNDLGGGDVALPSYHADTVWGNTFCQLFTVGLASYHFVGPDSSAVDADGDTNEIQMRAYISYENPRTEMWPDLDNGQSVPSRVPFRNIEWNAETRTFRGDICWEEDFGTTWMREAKWSYEIVFDPTFMFVKSGTCSRASGTDHRFGVDLIYINAALESPLREAARTTQSNTGEFLDVVRKWRDDDASSGTLEMLGNVAMSVIAERESMFDFNL